MIVHIFQYIKCEKKMNILEYEQEHAAIIWIDILRYKIVQ